MDKPKISVIVPIFGVEKYIKHCAESLMSQTMDGVEYIFVNDCTKDSSIILLEEVLAGHPDLCTKIIHHEQNRGLPSARNTGLQYATGEFIFHCDGDDYVEPTTLEKLYGSAIDNDADIVWSDYYEEFDHGSVYMHEPNYQSADDAISGMLGNYMKYNVWNKLIRSSLYKNNGVVFPDGKSMGEDLTIVKLFLHAKKVVYYPEALYHYVRSNTGAMTTIMSREKYYQLADNVASLEKYIKTHTGNKYENDLNSLKLWQKFPLIITNGCNGEYRLWTELFPEANIGITDHAKANGRIKWLERMADGGHFCFVWLHFFFVMRIYYSIFHPEIKV